MFVNIVRLLLNEGKIGVVLYYNVVELHAGTREKLGRGQRVFMMALIYFKHRLIMIRIIINILIIFPF